MNIFVFFAREETIKVVSFLSKNKVGKVIHVSFKRGMRKVTETYGGMMGPTHMAGGGSEGCCYLFLLFC